MHRKDRQDNRKESKHVRGRRKAREAQRRRRGEVGGGRREEEEEDVLKEKERHVKCAKKEERDIQRRSGSEEGECNYSNGGEERERSRVEEGRWVGVCAT